MFDLIFRNAIAYDGKGGASRIVNRHGLHGLCLPGGFVLWIVKPARPQL